MPTPFMCHGCDSPTMNKSGVCDNCNIEIKLDNTLPDTKYVNFLSDEEIMELDNIDEVSFEYLDNMQDYESYKKSIEDISSSTRIKFLYGYILEELLLLCASIAGHKVTDQQKEVNIEGVLGHQDSMIDDVLIDCKSASAYSFKKFKQNTLLEDDPFGYIAQISAYAEANQVNKAAFLVIDKSRGEICLTPVHQMEMINAKERVKHLKGMVSNDHIPDRCYAPLADGESGNFKLAIGCVYCSHKRECWSDCNNGQGLRAFRYSRGLSYLTTVAKEPKVEEVVNW